MSKVSVAAFLAFWSTEDVACFWHGTATAHALSVNALRDCVRVPPWTGVPSPERDSVWKNCCEDLPPRSTFESMSWVMANGGMLIKCCEGFRVMVTVFVFELTNGADDYSRSIYPCFNWRWTKPNGPVQRDDPSQEVGSTFALHPSPALCVPRGSLNRSL